MEISAALGALWLGKYLTFFLGVTSLLLERASAVQLSSALLGKERVFHNEMVV